MPDPILRAEMSSGKTWDDPSEDLLFDLLSDVERGDEEFIIILRLSDSSGQTYAQSARNGDGSYVVERRDGGPTVHFGFQAAEMRTAHEALTAWMFQVPGLADRYPWQKVF